MTGSLDAMTDGERLVLLAVAAVSGLPCAGKARELLIELMRRHGLIPIPQATADAIDDAYRRLELGLPISAARSRRSNTRSPCAEMLERRHHPVARISGGVRLGSDAPASYTDRAYLRGESHPNHHLTESDVREIMASRARSIDLARRYHVHVNTVWRIRTSRTWKHLTTPKGVTGPC